MAQWIRPQTLNREVPGSNMLSMAVVPLSKAIYPHCLVPQKGLKAVSPLHGRWKLETDNKVGGARQCLQTMGAPPTSLSTLSVPLPMVPWLLACKQLAFSVAR